MTLTEIRNAVISRMAAQTAIDSDAVDYPNGPVSLNDIELYLASRTILIDRIEFDAAILALDDAWRVEWAEEQKRQAKVK